MEVEQHEAENMLNVFCEDYNKINNSLIIKKFGSTYKMLLRDEMTEVIKKAVISKNLVKLSKASLETLAIIAYNQPITRAKVEDIRGVGCDGMIRKLIAKALIKEVGREESPGLPILYGVTSL